MPFFFPFSSGTVDLKMTIGTKPGVSGFALKIENVGDFLIPEHTEQQAAANPEFDKMTGEDKARYMLYLMLMVAEDSGIVRNV